MQEAFENLRQHKDQLLELVHHHHAKNLRVFGSVARGEAREDSDIDLLVEFLPDATLLDQVALSDALAKVLNRKVDVVSERALNQHLRERVLREAIAL